MFLLDTCVISELTKPKPHPAVIEWLDTHDEQTFFLSVLTLGEIEKGITKLPTSRKKKRIMQWFDHDVQQRFEGRILDVDVRVAVAWGKIQGEAEKKGEPVPTIDALLAATAEVHGLKVVTRNNTDIERTGVPTVDPWNE
ncbi:MAG: type II toxin-antitoxin system VapC family toxin [Bacteroidetes bacterium]|nr:type II toxin-antitoxin system VapC family toxin [Bacteroidota bacterium]MCW5895012.1 type II toxin-antitoxin system VapC family toxin [Bacteroidota bacterium]